MMSDQHLRPDPTAAVNDSSGITPLSKSLNDALMLNELATGEQLPAESTTPDKDNVAMSQSDLSSLAHSFHGKPVPKSRLMSLAAELRNRIWEFAVLEDGDVTPYNPYLRKRRERRLRLPALARVGRQIRSEALPIFLGRNTLRLFHESCEEASIGEKWIRMLGHNILHLKTVKLQLCENHPNSLILHLNNGAMSKCTLSLEPSTMPRAEECYLREHSEQLKFIEEEVQESLACANGRPTTAVEKVAYFLQDTYGKRIAYY